MFLQRCLRLCANGGTASVVLPQNWLFLSTYKKFREKLLKSESWRLLARLGVGAFETVTGEVVNAILLTLSHIAPVKPAGALIHDYAVDSTMMYGLDVSALRIAAEKAVSLPKAPMRDIEQARQLMNPDVRVMLDRNADTTILTSYASSYQGITTGDNPRFILFFWEHDNYFGVWSTFQSTDSDTGHFRGRHQIFLWEDGTGYLASSGAARIQGQFAWDKDCVVVRQMGRLAASLSSGNPWDMNCASIVPNNPMHLPAVWCFCSSPEYSEAVRRIDQKLNVTSATLAKVPFDLERWTRVAGEQFPNGLPRPYSDEPTQWIFHGHPCGSVVWDDTEKVTAYGPCRTAPTVLHAAVARLLGYRWPAEHDADMELAAEQREWVRRTTALLEWMDEDGIVCIPPVRGEPPARDRLLGLLAAAFGDSWNDAVLATLLANVDSNSLDDWLRDRFFDQHCKVFHHRPFIWHIWDGRRRDGFHALVNYHKLAAGEGKGRQLLESLTYSYLGDWIARQRDAAQRREEGAEDRLAAAYELKRRLEAILNGEPPFDIFVRWKPIHEQPIGWEPDINDGVRLNIRSFMAEDIPGGKKGAGILRAKPKISWKKDRGKEVLKPIKRSKPPWLQDDEATDVDEDHELRPREDYPWFWNCPGDGPLAGCTDFLGGSEFDGNRWNDLHYTNAMKSAARERKREWATTRKYTRERIDDVHMAATRDQSVRGRPDP